MVTAVWRQPIVGSQVSSVQRLASSQARAGPGVQLPAVQVSAPLQGGLPSPQGVLSATGVWTQPVSASQVSWVHTLPSSQSVSAAHVLSDSQVPVMGWSNAPGPGRPVVKSSRMPLLVLGWQNTEASTHWLVAGKDVAPSGTAGEPKPVRLIRPPFLVG